MKIRAALRLVLSCGLLLAGRAAGQEAVPLAAPDKPAAGRVEGAAMLASADEALAAGLPSVAADLYARAMAVGGEGDLVHKLATALSASGRGADAALLLSEKPVATPLWKLDMAVALLLQDKADEARPLLTLPFDENALPAESVPWYHFALGMLKAASGDAKGASDEYARAVQNAPQYLSSRVELAMLRDELEKGPVTADTIGSLREKVRSAAGQREGFEAARLLAVALAKSDRQMEALSVIDEALGYAGVAESGMRERLLILLAQLAGPETQRGRTALQEILMNPASDRHSMMNAVAMLYSAEDAAGPDAFRGVLDAVISANPSHPLMDALLLLRSDNALKAGRYDDSSFDARRIVDQFPASTLRHAALRTMAYIAFVRTPPQYRTAASTLAGLRGELPDGPERAQTGVLIADCFFLNGDFANAAAAYTDAFDEPVPDRGLVFYQMVLSLIRAGRGDEARAALDAARGDPSIDLESRWKAEWNLIYSMRALGRQTEAFARLDALLSATGADQPPPTLRLRLLWLQAQLSLEAGQSGRTPGMCGSILEELARGGSGAPEASQKEEIASQTMLLKARAELSLGNDTAAEATFEGLRVTYPDSVAAQNSYLVQARSLARRERLVDAQRLLLSLADRYPQSDLAPVALWEAALSAEQRGLEATYREALQLLDRLVGSYPQSALVFHARLRQGDILRKLNDFGTALLAYEDVMNRFPSHPDLHLAQMGRADCIIALSATNPARRADGIAVYERLMERRDLPGDFLAEASFKWAYNVDKQGDSVRAIDAYWSLLSSHVSDASGSSLSPRGRYWISRAAVELGQLLESAGRYGEARRVYTLMLESNLPGRALARARLKRLDEPRTQQ
jgi:tetratricopeptide (TPR) repeat protein